MKNKLLRIGIVGTGLAAKTYAAVLRATPGVVLAGMAGRDFDKAQTIARTLKVPWCARSATELVSSPFIDAVIIAVSPTAQPDIAVEAFTHRKHVLCEKPLALNLSDAHRIAAAGKASRRIGMMDFCYRLIPQFQEFKKYLAAGICGSLHSVHAEWILANRLNKNLTYHWKGQKESGGGVLQNFGIHLLDFLFYDEPSVRVLGAVSKVFIKTRPDAKGRQHVATGDEVSTVLLSVGNVAYSIHCSLVTAPPQGCRIIARGSEGTLELRSEKPERYSGPYSLWIFKKDMEHGRRISIGRQEISPKLFPLFFRSVERFVKAIRRKNISAGDPTIESGFRATKLLSQIQAISNFI